MFLKPVVPPYIIYRDDGFENIAANSRTVLKKQRVAVEVYARITQISQCEHAVESILDSFTTYTKERAYDDAQGLYVTYYNFYLR